LVLLVGEVAEAREPVDQAVEALSPRQLAHVAVDVFDLESARRCVFTRALEEELGHVEPGHAEASLGERVGDAPVAAGAVEDLGTRLALEQLDDPLDLFGRALGEEPLVEVEVVLVEDAFEVEPGHESNLSISMCTSP